MESKEDKLLLAQTEDKIRQCSDKYMITNSLFMDMRQRSLVEAMLRTRKGVRYGFYGGYDDAERVISVFLPDYIDSELVDYFSENPEDNPITLIRVSLKKGSPNLSHRDYLGSIMGLGLKREMTGDILVRESGADIIALREISEFIVSNMQKAGRAKLDIEELPVSELIAPKAKKQDITESVASLRLDNVISAAFGVARSKASEAIASGLVFVNGIEAAKSERQVKEGDKLVFRGKGKAVLKEAGRITRKGRIIITIERYL